MLHTFKSNPEIWEKNTVKWLEAHDDLLGITKEARAYMNWYNALPWYKKLIHKYTKRLAQRG